MIDLMLTMPRLGETMEEGVIVGWLVRPGESFRRGEPILEVETDKTVVEFPALGDGVIEDVLAGPGDKVPVGEPVARAKVASRADWSDEADEAPSTAGESGPPDGASDGLSILTMPRLGETMDEGVVVGWLVAEGERYERGRAILEIETDKTVAEVPALHEGRLIRILAQPGEKLAVGSPIAEIEGRVETPAAAETQPMAAQSAPEPVPSAHSAGLPASEGPLRATPLARRMARQKGVTLDRIRGTGRRGRIEHFDVERFEGEAASTGAFALDRPDGRIATTREGTGGRTHVLVHGFAGDRTAWAQTSSALVRAGQRVLSLDLPGHGETGVQAAGLEALVEALVRQVAAEPEPVTLVGHSLGAAVAALAARSLGSKVERLVLLAPAGCGGRIGAEFLFGMAGARTAGEVSHLLRLLGSKSGVLSQDALERMATETRRGRLRALADAVATPEGRQRVDILGALGEISAKIPVTAVFGTQDTIVAPTDAFNLPAAVSVHFVAAGHMPQWDAPREVASLVLNGV